MWLFVSLRAKDVIVVVLKWKRKVESALIPEQGDEKLSDSLDPPTILI